jgi:ribosomal protein L37AE/L43A
MEKSNIISALKGRLDDLEKWRKEKTDKKKGEKKQKTDEEVCPECGGDLLFVEEGIVFCPKCEQYFEIGEEEE